MELNKASVIMGCDVEFFFERDNKVIGSEKVIKKSEQLTGYSNVVIDGVQAELNPRPSYCRALIGNELHRCFNSLYKIAKERNVDTNFNGVIEIDEKEFASLSENSKKFGCDPDFNTYKNGEANVIKVNPATYNKRSAGGHIHLGSTDLHYTLKGEVDKKCIDCPAKCKKYTSVDRSFNNIHDQSKIENIITSESNKILDRPDILIPLLDLLVGIPSVLLDRDPYASERRKVYGKAGDYRLPKHGIEYRTLSNWWIKEYVLTSFVFGMARMAYSIAVQDMINNNTKIQDALFNGIDKKDIVKAINTNNFNLARDIFLKYESVLIELGNRNTNAYPINMHTIHGFYTIVINGYKHYFPDNTIFERWNKMEEGHEHGWEAWAVDHDDYERDQFIKVVIV